MRKTVYIVVLLCIAMMSTTGCKNTKPAQDADSIDTATAVVDTADSDTMAEIIAETPMPKAADQLFDDFFFNFIASPKVQKERTNWPLPVITYNDKQEHKFLLQKNQWKMDKFFRKQGYYTLIFDNEKQMDLAKSIKLDTVVVEKIHLQEGTVDQYCFDHQDGKWRLNQIRKISFEDSRNASFLNFLQTFFARRVAGMITTRFLTVEQTLTERRQPS